LSYNVKRFWKIQTCQYFSSSKIKTTYIHMFFHLICKIRNEHCSLHIIHFIPDHILILCTYESHRNILPEILFANVAIRTMTNVGGWPARNAPVPRIAPNLAIVKTCYSWYQITIIFSHIIILRYYVCTYMIIRWKKCGKYIEFTGK
jgi:hypothetical protein